MKTIIIFILTISILKLHAAEKPAEDSTQVLKQLNTSAQALKTNAQALQAMLKDTSAKKTTCPPFCGSRSNKMNGYEIFLSLLPVILVVLFFIVFNLTLGGSFLREALNDEPDNKTIMNPEYNTTNLSQLDGKPGALQQLPATVSVSTEPTKSASRILSFITSCVAVMLATCLSSFYIYTYFKTGAAIDLSGYSNILLSLGIGVVPYAFNKVSTAMSSEPKK